MSIKIDHLKVCFFLSFKRICFHYLLLYSEKLFFNFILNFALLCQVSRNKDANLKKVHAMHKGKIPPNISYTESDQSPVYGEDAFWLSFDLGTGLDNNTPLCSHLSDWY